MSDHRVRFGPNTEKTFKSDEQVTTSSQRKRGSQAPKKSILRRPKEEAMLAHRPERTSSLASAAIRLGETGQSQLRDTTNALNEASRAPSHAARTGKASAPKKRPSWAGLKPAGFAFERHSQVGKRPTKPAAEPRDLDRLNSFLAKTDESDRVIETFFGAEMFVWIEQEQQRNNGNGRHVAATLINFDFTPRDEPVDLRKNNIHQLPPVLVRGLLHYKDIDLTGNPLRELPSALFGEKRGVNSVRWSDGALKFDAEKPLKTPGEFSRRTLASLILANTPMAKVLDLLPSKMSFEQAFVVFATIEELGFEPLRAQCMVGTQMDFDKLAGLYAQAVKQREQAVKEQGD